MKKSVLFSSIAVAVLASSTMSYAATEAKNVEPAAAPAPVEVKIDVTNAIEAAQAKFADAKVRAVSLHQTRDHGLAWIVRMEGADKKGVRVYVNPTDGKILGSKEITLQDGGMHHDMQGAMECMGKMSGMHGGDHGRNHGGMQCMDKMGGAHGGDHGGMKCMDKMGGAHGGDHGGMQCMSKMGGMHDGQHGAHHDGTQGEHHASGHGAGKGC